MFYDADGKEIARYTLHVGEGLQIPVGQFHTIEVKEPSVLLEIKDGAYSPTKSEDIIENNIKL